MSWLNLQGSSNSLSDSDSDSLLVGIGQTCSHYVYFMVYIAYYRSISSCMPNSSSYIIISSILSLSIKQAEDLLPSEYGSEGALYHLCNYITITCIFHLKSLKRPLILIEWGRIKTQYLTKYKFDISYQLSVDGLPSRRTVEHPSSLANFMCQIGWRSSRANWPLRKWFSEHTIGLP